MSSVLLSVSNLHKRYGPNTVLAGIDLEILEGETVAVLGHSGCGKTTLLRCIAALLNFEEGLVTFAGNRLAEANKKRLPSWQRRRNIVMVLQSYSLIPNLTVERNITLPLEKVQNKSKEIAKEDLY